MKTIKEKYLLFKVKTFNDPDAYAEIYDNYAPRIYRFIFFKVGNKADAEDLTSETFLKVWEYLKDGQQVKYLNALFYSVARHIVIDFYRFRAKRNEIEEPITTDVPTGQLNMLEKMDIKQDTKVILKSLKLLKDEYNEVLVLKYLNELSVGEISKIIDKSPNNTRVLIHRALTALRKMVKSE